MAHIIATVILRTSVVYEWHLRNDNRAVAKHVLRGKNVRLNFLTFNF